MDAAEDALAPDPDAFLRGMARRYVWDQTETEALANPARIIRRVMDLGVIEHALDLEPQLGCARLIDILRASPAGAMRPRSWWFWHYRLGLADATHDPPPMPVRSYD